MTKLHRRRRQQADGYTEEHVGPLVSGFDFEGVYLTTDVPTRVRWPEGADDVVHQAKAAAWEVLGEGITAQWAQEQPFTRCWGWWKFSAPERRRCTSGEHPYDLYDRAEWTGHLPKRYTFGLPGITAGPGYDRLATFESEFDYLCRLPHLLSDHERQLLANKSYPAPAASAASGSTNDA